MKTVQFTSNAHAQLLFWEKTNRKTYFRILQLLEAIQSNAFKGIGKPEPLRGELSGYWSRRIDREHRLVYRITNEAIIVIACRYHY